MTSSEPVYLTGYEERQHHHRPLSFGLTVAYPLTGRLSLTTGVVYTKLVSDFTQVMRSQQIEQQQTLHYVGIPLSLGLSWYPDNKSRLQNFFKDKPVNPSLQVGLRVNLQR